MHELLAVSWVALVRVEGDELVLVDFEEGLPDGSEAVVGKCLTAMGNVGDETPGVTILVLATNQCRRVGQ